MDRLTVNDDNVIFDSTAYHLRCACTFNIYGEFDDISACCELCEDNDHDCTRCGIQEAFRRLGEYEDTELKPSQISTMKELYDNLAKLIEDALNDIKHISCVSCKHCITSDGSVSEECRECSHLSNWDWRYDSKLREALSSVEKGVENGEE